MGNKLKKFRQNENTNSVDFTQKLNALVDAVNKANNINVNIKGGTGGVKHTPNGHSINVNIPHINQTTSGNYINVRNAFVDGTVSSGATQDCFLDVDTTGEEITVYCTICGGTALDESLPRLEDGKLLPVYFDGTYWRSCTIFQASEDCT